MKSSQQRVPGSRHQRAEAIAERHLAGLFARHLMQALAELADERPEAVGLMRGRTFARAIH